VFGPRRDGRFDAISHGLKIASKFEKFIVVAGRPEESGAAIWKSLRRRAKSLSRTGTWSPDLGKMKSLWQRGWRTFIL